MNTEKPLHIAVIGTGNVGGTLAGKWARAGHRIYLGVRGAAQFQKPELTSLPKVSVHEVAESVAAAEVILIATPAMTAIEVAQSLGDTTGKVIVDAMNIVAGRGPKGYSNTAQALLDHTQTTDVVKCFNTTGFNNMADPDYGGTALDLFTAGDSARGKALAQQLARDAGFAECYDIGGNDRFDLMEQFAWFWINLAMFQGQGREIGFKLLKR